MFNRLSAESAQSVSLSVPAVETVSPEPVFDPVELYLFQIDAKLLSLSPEMRIVVLEEIRQHLHASVSAREELGMPHDTATQEAMKRFGKPERIAQNLCRVWREKETAFPGAAFSQALILFGGCGAAVCIPAVLNTFGVVTASLNIGAMVLLYPIIAGFWVGLRAPSRAAMGTLLALAALLFCSLPLTWLNWTLRSDSQWLTPGFLPFLFFLWTLPGCLTASVTARIVDFSHHRKTVQ